MTDIKDSDLIGGKKLKKSMFNFKNVSIKQRNITMVTFFIMLVMVIIGISMSSGSNNHSGNKSSITPPAPMDKSGNDNSEVNDKIKALMNERNQKGADEANFVPILSGKLKAPPVILNDVPPPLAQSSEAIIQHHAEDIAAKKAAGDLLSQSMLTQMQSLQSSWYGSGSIPSKIEFISSKDNAESDPNNGDVASNPTDHSQQPDNTADPVEANSDEPMYIRAGETMYAYAKMEVNSDYGGVVILEGIDDRIKGVTIIADEYTVHDIALTIRPTRMIMPDKTVGITAYAINPETDMGVVASEVDTHLFERWGSFILSTLLDGLGEYASLIQAQGVATSATLGSLSSTVTSTPKYSVSQQGWIVGGKVLSATSDSIKGHINRPNTVYIHKNDVVKLLFLEDVNYQPITVKNKNSPINEYEMGRRN